MISPEPVVGSTNAGSNSKIIQSNVAGLKSTVSVNVKVAVIGFTIGTNVSVSTIVGAPHADVLL
jgi:hypothetical protein